MNKEKYNWERIFKESTKLIIDSINHDEKLVTNISGLYEMLENKYIKEKREKELPGISILRKKFHNKLNINPSQKIVKSVLYQLAGAYDKMTLEMLAENITVTTDEVADRSSWLFIRINTEKIKSKNKSKHLYYLAGELKKKFSREIIFISFDTDTLVIMCADNDSRNTIISYFDKSVIPVTIISEQED